MYLLFRSSGRFSLAMIIQTGFCLLARLGYYNPCLLPIYPPRSQARPHLLSSTRLIDFDTYPSNLSKMIPHPQLVNSGRRENLNNATSNRRAASLSCSYVTQSPRVAEFVLAVLPSSQLFYTSIDLAVKAFEL